MKNKPNSQFQDSRLQDSQGPDSSPQAPRTQDSQAHASPDPASPWTDSPFQSLYDRIQTFYDTSSSLWESTWGEHMHHGFYGVDGRAAIDRRQAQIDLIEQLLNFGQVFGSAGTVPERILDLGCGIGGSTCYLLAKGARSGTGVTLSPVQAERAQVRAQQLGFGDRARFQVANALDLPFADNSFDLVWSLESGEHMPDKARFLQEACRVLKPGGTLLVATWCHRPIDSQPLQPWETALLQGIYQLYHLPGVCSLPDYAEIARSLPLTNLRTADWSRSVAPFWDQVIASALDPAIAIGILQAGWPTVQGAFALGLMHQGYAWKLIRYGVLSGIKT